MSTASPQAGGSYRTDPKTGDPVLIERTEEARVIDPRKPGAAPAEAAPTGKKRAEDKE